MKTKFTTQAQIRALFWNEFHGTPGIGPYRKRWKQNQYNTDTRCAFVDFVEALSRDGWISEALAHRVTL